MMNEESVLEPNSIIEQANEAIRVLHEANARLEASGVPMTAFIEDNTLVTRGINLLKQKMREMKSIIDALILANLADIRDYQKLITLVSQVEGDINGRVTLSLLNQTEGTINFIGGRLERARWNLNSEMSFPHVAPRTEQTLRNTIRRYERALDGFIETKHYLNSRIDLFNSIEYESRNFFKEGAALREHAMSGFEMIQQAAAGLPNSFSHPGLSGWRTTLETKKENLADIKVAKATELLVLLSEQGVVFPEDWTEEEKLEFAHRYLAEMRLLTAFMNENFPETDFEDNHRESLAFQRAEQIAWFFLSDPKLSFTLTFEQRVELMNVIENTTMHDPVVAFFESLGYNDADGGLLRLSEASNLATHATFVHRAAESGTTVDNWFASLAAMGVFEGVMKVGSLPRNIPQQTGQQSMPTTDFSVNEVPKPTPKSPGRTLTLSNGRVVNVQTGGGRIIQGNLQNPHTPRMVNVNGEWMVKQVPKYTESEVNRIVSDLRGDGFANNPLRLAYEKDVVNIRQVGEQMLAQGKSSEDVARTLHQMRRDLGVKYKDATPQPLRDFIYEINRMRYKGDPLGGSFDFFMEKYRGNYMTIIKGATKPNPNVDALLREFEKWLRSQ